MSPRPGPRTAEAMVASLGALPPRIARAMERVPRHRFLPSALEPRAYEDEPLPLEAPEATISAPHMVAIQLEAADLSPGQSVLEIGSGSGYLIALAAELTGPGARLLGIEIDPGLAARARVTLDELGYRSAEIRVGDGRHGAPGAAPFDRILVSCATPEIVPAWREQLTPDGRIVAPVGPTSSQTLVRTGRDPLRPPVLGPACRFVFMRSARPRPPAHI